MSEEENYLRCVYDCLGDALDGIDSAIGAREDGKIKGLPELDHIRTEIHNLTCSREFESIRNAKRRRM